MSITKITSDGVCVYVHTKITTDKPVKRIVQVAFVALVIGILMLVFSGGNSILGIIGMLLVLFGGIIILPMLPSLLWNLYGEEFLSFSTKSIDQTLSFGIFRLNPERFEYDDRLKYEFEILREHHGIKEGVIHFFSYDKSNQPFHLFQTKSYITEKECEEIIAKLRLIFILDDNRNMKYWAN